MSDDEWAVPPLAVAPPSSSADGVVARVQAPLDFLPRGFPHPRKRSALEGAFAAARMRERRAQRRANVAMDGSICILDKAISYLKECGVVSRLGLVRIRAICRKSSEVSGLDLQLVGHGRRAVRLSFQEMLDIGYSSVRRRNELAKAYNIDPNTVTRARVAVASSFHRTWSIGLAGMTALFDSRPPLVFGAGLSYDETK